ncbi:MAG TPA: response regulator, partial [Elusimicrobiales bacterium]|nr:response regulator [Elusimicrobiales bacterium]
MYRIMSIEDDPMMQSILKHIMLSAGHDCFFIATGAGAVQLAAAEKPDLILLDYGLPDMPGPQICVALKSDPATKHIPVIILTGEARAVENRVIGLDSGADDYLFKPISPRLLLARITA